MYKTGVLVDFVKKLNRPIAKAIDQRHDIEEIRIRADRPVMVMAGGREYYITRSGNLIRTEIRGQKTNDEIVVLNFIDINIMFTTINENSVYAYQDEIKKGYITIKGGHRIGLAGKTVLSGDGSVNLIKDISGLNFRVAKEITGCSDKLLKYIIRNPYDIYNTLIVSPPGTGKTTLLRDLTRNLSNGGNNPIFHGMNIGVVDERSEIAACYKGMPQNDVGARTDVLDGCPKATGMMMLLRSMAPRIIVTDEIGGTGDAEAVRCVANAGVRLLATAHGYCQNDLNDLRKDARELVEEGIFQKIIVLDNSAGPGSLNKVIENVGIPVESPIQGGINELNH